MYLLSLFNSRLRRFFENINAFNTSLTARQLLLQAQLIAHENRKKTYITNLKDIEFKAFSQWGEDGIIDWLISRLPFVEHSFIEFGVSDYRESNTRLLLELRNWKGLIIDGAEKNISTIKNQDTYWRHDLTAKQSFITTENINQTISDAGFSGNVGLLSIDIDGNDYWVWDAINIINPAIVICEFNTALGDVYPLTIPYKENFQRSEAHHSLLYFGASVQALILLGKRKGYTCIGSTSSGCNVFFIRNDLAKNITAVLEKISIFPCKAREARDKNSNMLYIDGIEGNDIISHMPVIEILEDGNLETSFIKNKKNLFSKEWLSGHGVKIENSV